MKKILALTMACTMVFGMVGCSSSNKGETANAQAKVVENANVKTDANSDEIEQGKNGDTQTESETKLKNANLCAKTAYNEIIRYLTDVTIDNDGKIDLQKLNGKKFDTAKENCDYDDEWSKNIAKGIYDSFKELEKDKNISTDGYIYIGMKNDGNSAKDMYVQWVGKDDDSIIGQYPSKISSVEKSMKATFGEYCVGEI